MDKSEATKKDAQRTRADIVSLFDAQLEKEAVKAQFLQCLGAHSNQTTTPRQLIPRALALDVGRRELPRCAVRTGYPEDEVQKLLTQVPLDYSIRRRRRGAGPETPQAAQALLACAREWHREPLAEKPYLAAKRTAKNQRLAQGQQAQPIFATLRT